MDNNILLVLKGNDSGDILYFLQFCTVKFFFVTFETLFLTNLNRLISGTGWPLLWSITTVSTEKLDNTSNCV